MHRTRNAAAPISARMVLSFKALFYLDNLARLSVMCRLVSSTASGLGSKMVARCSVSVPRTGRIEHNLAKVGVEGSNPFARSNAFKGLAPQAARGAKP
jgi:hypothetical protein